MRNFRLRNSNSERGGAMVEFALVLPLLFMMCMGATDFGRLFFHAVTVNNAAGTGAFYGARTPVFSGQFATMQQRAEEDANDLGPITSGVSANAERFCECDDGSPINCAQAANLNACPGYGAPIARVKVTVQNTFETLGPYPGIPDSTVVGREIWMRVQ